MLHYRFPDTTVGSSNNIKTQLNIPKIILDSDFGGDDFLSFLWLLSLVKQGLAELIAVTAADVNVTASRKFSVATKILRLFGFQNIEVGQSVAAARKAVEDNAHINEVNRVEHLSYTLPYTAAFCEESPYSDEIIISKLNAAPGEITLVAIGPLINLAAAETKHPGILKKAKELFVLAEAFQCLKNPSVHTNSNCWFNPETSQIVFDSRDDIMLL
ncbi:nucleoside hydrolase [Nostoc sp. 106C]|uniref:nucleoside hydrolase n=1 Tax=Nostoc sp. 106C TaxID=1932667 RepID=UPI000A3C5379|nr:nucleoside hydrolase [Nostoc sp. 106C]OUL33238.1 hypothetical protein BV375_07455 [Nostoc sp. 106C]